MADPVAWPLMPGGQTSERLDWLTDFMRATVGSEQRVRLRETPRVVLEFGAIAHGNDRRRLATLLTRNGSGTWWVPWPMEGQQLLAPLAAGGDEIAVDTRWRHFSEGGRLILHRVGERPEVLTVEGFDASSVTTTAGALADWPAGTMVYPAFRGRLVRMPDARAFTGDATSFTAQFRADEPIDWPAAAGATSYRGLPVFDLFPDWGEEPASIPDRTLLTVSNETALPFVFDPVRQPRNLITMPTSMFNLEQVAAARSLMYALAGGWGVAWVPTVTQDLAIVATVANGASTVDVARLGLSEAPLLENCRDVVIVLHDGTRHYRRLLDADLVGPAIERLTVDAPFGTGFSPDQVAQVSFLQLCRQEADSNLIRSWSIELATTLFEFRAEARHGL